MHSPAQSDYRAIYNLSMEFMDPQGAEWAMKTNLKSKIKLQNKTILKDQLICLKNVGTNETQCLAMKIGKKIKYNKEKVMERLVKFVMNIKIEDAIKDIQNDKEKVKKQEEELGKIVRPNTIAGKEFRKYAKSEIEKNWKVKKEKSKTKVTHLTNKFSRKIGGRNTEKVPDKLFGVRIDDKSLEDIEKPKAVIIHEDTKLNDLEKKSLEVLPKDTFYNRISIKDAEQQSEVSFAKQRWNEKKGENDENDKKIFDVNTRVIDLSNKKATDMRSNQRVKLIEPDIDDEKETKRDHLKLKIKDTYGEYINKYCTKDGDIKSVMDEELNNGLKSLKEKGKADKITILPTDKTNKMSVMTPDLYVVSMKEHHENDNVISKKELNKIQRNLNEHSKSTVKVFNVGKGYGQYKRALGNSTVHEDGQVPV